jgi:glucose/arabinose dehydrogenase
LSRPAPSRRLRGGALALAAALLAAACSIETADEASTTTTAPPTTAPAATTTLPPDQRPPGLAQVSVELSQLGVYTVPLTLTATRPGSESIFVGSRTGGIYEIKRDVRRDPRTGYLSYTVRPQTSAWADLSGQVLTEEGADWGLHGFAFSTDGARLYASFTNRDAKTLVVELRISNNRVSPTSQRTLMEIDNPDRSRNAGPIAVGSDGYLHITLGDGGGGEGDNFENAQDPTRFLGKVLRIDPETGGENPYNLVPGNPFFDELGDDDGQDEIYLMGLRDPQAISFDPLTRDGWILDTGAEGIQEINLLEWVGQPRRGGNLGWPLMNGMDQYEGDEPPDDAIAPLQVYGPDQGCQIVGGATYHGNSIPGLDGAYLFGDRCTGRILAIKVEDGEIAEGATLPVTVAENTLSAIGLTPDGEPVIVQEDGTVSQMVFLPPPEG